MKYEELEARVKENPNHIIARIDTGLVPAIIESTHPEFEEGFRFDYNFFNRAFFRDNYSVLLVPQRETKGYVIVQRIDFENRNEARHAGVWEANADNFAVYGRVKETNQDYNRNHLLNKDELASSLQLWMASFLFEI